MTDKEQAGILADQIVRSLYGSFDDSMLEMSLQHGMTFEPNPVVDAMNEAILRELARRTSEREARHG